MKRLAVTVLVAAGLIFTAPMAVRAEVKKLGYVDLSYIFDNYHKTKEYDKVLEADHKIYESDRNKKIDAVREKQGQLGLLAEDKKAALEQEIQKLKEDLDEFDKQQREDLTKKRNEKIREILLEIENIVSVYAEKEGYDMIFNDRVLIYGAQVLNITQTVLDQLNAK